MAQTMRGKELGDLLYPIWCMFGYMLPFDVTTIYTTIAISEQISLNLIEV